MQNLTASARVRSSREGRTGRGRHVHRSSAVPHCLSRQQWAALYSSVSDHSEGRILRSPKPTQPDANDTPTLSEATPTQSRIASGSERAQRCGEVHREESNARAKRCSSASRYTAVVFGRVSVTKKARRKGCVLWAQDELVSARRSFVQYFYMKYGKSSSEF